MALGIKVTSSALSPKYYLITYEDGQRERVVVTKNDHICPSYCNVDHAHKVNICEGDCEHVNESFTINKQAGKNNTFSLYCKGKEIMLFEQIEKNRIDSKRLCCMALIDPDIKNEGKLDQIIRNINNSNFSGILVGGSLIMDDKFEMRAKYIFENTDLPIFIFPGSSNQVTVHCDFLLYLTLLSGRNPQ